MKASRLVLITLIIVGLLIGVMTGRAGATSPESQQGDLLSEYWHYRIQRWDQLIVQAAEKRDLDPDFLASLVWMESRGDARAVGPVGAIGLMQVMPKEAGFSWRPTREVLMDPATNLFWGTRTLATVIRQGKGDIFNALAAYNGGWEQIMYRGPKHFATTILRDYAQAVAMRHGLQGHWIAYFGVQTAIAYRPIRGPIWIADSTRTDVYLYGKHNWLPDGSTLIPERQPPTSLLARCEDDETGDICDVGLWLYSVDEEMWVLSNSPNPPPTRPWLRLSAHSLPKPTMTPQLVSAAPIPRPVVVTPIATPQPTPLITEPINSQAPLVNETHLRASAMFDAVVIEGGAQLRPGATTWWLPRKVLPAGTALDLLGHDPNFKNWVFVSTLDGSNFGWVQLQDLATCHRLSDLPLVTPVPTPVPTAQPSPTPTSTPSVMCYGEELSVEAWPLKVYNTVDGWAAEIYARGKGGSCVYTYAWNRDDNVKGGPMSGPVVFKVGSPRRDAVILGSVIVTSGEESLTVGLYIKPPGSKD